MRWLSSKSIPPPNEPVPVAVILPLELILPCTSNFSPGVDVPIPTLPELEINIFVVGPPAELLVFNSISSLPLIVWRTKLLATASILDSEPSLSK